MNQTEVLGRTSTEISINFNVSINLNATSWYNCDTVSAQEVLPESTLEVTLLLMTELAL